MTKTQNKFPFVEVEWEDALSVVKWSDDLSKIKPPTVLTRGWLVHESLTYIILAGTICQDGPDLGYGELICLPLGIIVNIFPLNVQYEGDGDLQENA